MVEILDIVDENDNVLYTATKEEMFKKRLLHRICGTFVFNSVGEIFVHKRAKTKRIYPDTWSILFGGSVMAGETYEEGAKRELFEESGIKNIKLTFHFKKRFTNDIDYIFTSVYSCTYDGKIKLQKSEIEKGMFVSVKELKQMMNKEKFCPDEIIYFRMYEKMKTKK